MAARALPKAAALLAAAASSLLYRASPVAGQEGCISDLADIVDAELNLAPRKIKNELRTYVLCPGTTFDIGILQDDYSYAGGQPTLELFNPNINVLCGEDGSADNGCVFQGGSFHIDSYLFDPLRDPALTNVLVSGVTFSGATENNVRTETTGEITLKDCKFTGNDNYGSIAQYGNFTASKLTLDGCTFESNTASFETEDDGVTALIYNIGQELVVQNCLFQNNAVVTPGGVVVPDDWSTSVIGAFEGGNTEITESCFVDNVNVFAPVYAEDATVNVDFGLSFGSGDYMCNGLAEFVDVDPFAYDCFELQGESCSLLQPIESTVAPMIAPTSVPTAAPTATPAEGTTDGPTGAPTAAGGTPSKPPTAAAETSPPAPESTVAPTSIPTSVQTTEAPTAAGTAPPTEDGAEEEAAPPQTLKPIEVLTAPPTDPPTPAPAGAGETAPPTDEPPASAPPSGSSKRMFHGLNVILVAFANALYVAFK